MFVRLSLPRRQRLFFVKNSFIWQARKEVLTLPIYTFFAQDFGTRLRLFNNPTFVSHFSHLISILTLIPRKPIFLRFSLEKLVGFYAQEFFGGAPMRINEVGRRKMLKGSRKLKGSWKINSKPIYGLAFVFNCLTKFHFLADLLDEPLGNSFNVLDFRFYWFYSLDFDCRVVVKFFGEMQWSQRVSELFMGFTTEINFLSSALGSSRRQIEVGSWNNPKSS